MSRKSGPVSKTMAVPTALVAATTGGRRRRRRKKSNPAQPIADRLRSLPGAIERAVPGGRRSPLPFGGRRRRRSDLMRMARHAGAAVSAVSFAADLISQVNAISAAASHDSSPDHRTGRESRPSTGGRKRSAPDRQESRAPRSGGSRSRSSGSEDGNRQPARARAGGLNGQNPIDEEEE